MNTDWMMNASGGGADTVAAISTPTGKGGIAVIRISGDEAVSVASRMFQPMNGKALGDCLPRMAIYGKILSQGEIIDSGIATVFRAPHSFTGEDVVEISCHGGMLLTAQVLRAAFLCGAEAAGPGEFTKRAFLHGKLSLTEAEGVIDLIDAESMEQIRLASAQSRGLLTDEIEAISGELRRLLASVYAYIDYPDEDLTDVSVEEMQAILSALRVRIDRLADSYRSGRAVKEGIQTVLIGKPNTGKSSLLNRILGQERAIVTDIPGTTRDTVEESASLGRVMLRLCDTAGIRKTEDRVEQIGVDRALAQMAKADLILGMLDGSRMLDEEDREILEKLKTEAKSGRTVILVVNKSDLPAAFGDDELPSGLPVCRLSANREEAKELLRDLIEPRFFDGSLTVGSSAILSNERQYAAICQARDALSRADEALSFGLTQDMAGMDLELALAALGLTDGRSITGEIVTEIFSRFCVGK